MNNTVYFKCKCDNLIGLWKESDDEFWYGFLRKIQKTWPKNKTIVFNKGTENECEVEYVTWSRIDANPIFKIIKGEWNNVKDGVFGNINDHLFKSEKIEYIQTLGDYET
jgi:hypothetical protein